MNSLHTTIYGSGAFAQFYIVWTGILHRAHLHKHYICNNIEVDSFVKCLSISIQTTIQGLPCRAKKQRTSVCYVSLCNNLWHSLRQMGKHFVSCSTDIILSQPILEVNTTHKVCTRASTHIRIQLIGLEMDASRAWRNFYRSAIARSLAVYVPPFSWWSR